MLPAEARQLQEFPAFTSLFEAEGEGPRLLLFSHHLREEL